MSAGQSNGIGSCGPGLMADITTAAGSDFNTNGNSDQPSAAEGSPEVLGSVVQNHELENGDKYSCIQLRTSARVSKKMRLDYIASQTPPEKKEPPPPKEEEKVEVKPKRRTWELWPPEDKNTFFEALNEFGKDFDAIQKFFEAKARRKNVPEYMMKNREQIRHFYYRIWHKISKHLKFPDEVKKVTQELYGLINFGELRKKLGGVSEKTSLKLNELIYRGFTQIRLRGKTIRVKTPICRALRKLNQQEEPIDDLKLPPRVTIELRPRTTEAWARVQSIAQNPRIRTVLPLQRRLSSLINFLQHRWQPHPQRYCEKLQAEINEVTAAIKSLDEVCSIPRSATASSSKDETSVITTNNEELNNTNSTKNQPNVTVNTSRPKPSQRMRVHPPNDANIVPLSVNLSEYFTSTRLSLNSHEERLGNHGAEELFNSMLMASNKWCGRKGSKRQRHDSSSDKKKEQLLQQQQQLLQQQSIDSSPEKSKESTSPGINSLATTSTNDIDKSSCPFRLFGSGVCTDGDAGRSENQSSTSNQAVTPPKEEGNGLLGANLIHTTPVLNSNATSGSNSENLLKNGETAAEAITRIKAGWTFDSSQAVTIGALYLMFGSDSKVVLEYAWEDSPVDPDATLKSNAEEKSTQSSPSTVSNGSPSSTPDNGASSAQETKSSPLALTMQKLLSIAKLQNVYQKPVPCPCGHTCSYTTKSSTTKAKTPKPIRFSVDPDKIPRIDGSVENANLLNSTISTSPLSQHDGPFRRPLMPSPQFKPPPRPGTVEAFKAQLEKFRPRYCGRRGRPASARKSVVVPRMLPLLPKTPASPLLTLQVIPQAGQVPGRFRPITQSPSVLNFSPSASNMSSVRPVSRKGPETATATNTTVNATPATLTLSSQPSSTCVLSMPNSSQENTALRDTIVSPVKEEVTVQSSPSVPDLFPSNLDTPVSSPPSISNLLDMSLSNELNLNSNQFLETNFAGLLSNDRDMSSPPSPSPSAILKEDEGNWLNSEVADFSLSSFLGHLESPIKTTSSSCQPLSDNIEQPSIASDVDTQMQCLMTENSLDYMVKFADLAAQIASDGTK